MREVEPVKVFKIGGDGIRAMEEEDELRNGILNNLEDVSRKHISTQSPHNSKTGYIVFGAPHTQSVLHLLKRLLKLL